jgi:hypothetical protein
MAPVEQLSDKQLRDQANRAARKLKELDSADPSEIVRSGKVDATIAQMENAISMRDAAQSEIRKREFQEAVNDIPRARTLRAMLPRGERKAKVVLDKVAQLGHPELQGETLVAANLSDEEGDELAALLKGLRMGIEPLTTEETKRYEQLAGKAAGNETIFRDKREEKKREKRMAELREKQRQALPHTDPRSRALVGAILSDASILDLMTFKLRDDVTGTPEGGYEALRILEIEDVGALVLTLSLIAENGGASITINTHGAPLGSGGKYPFLPTRSLRQLSANGYLSMTQVSEGYSVGLGERVTAICERWGIRLPVSA